MLLNPKSIIQEKIHHSTPATFRDGHVETCWSLNILWQIKSDLHLALATRIEQFLRSPSAVDVSCHDMSEFNIVIIIIEFKSVNDLSPTYFEITNLVFHFLLQQNTSKTNLKT